MLAPHRRELLERLEDTLLIGGRNPGPGVADGETQLASVAGERDRNRALRRELQGVVREVDHDESQQTLVCNEARRRSVDVELESEPVGLGERAKFLGAVVHEMARIGRLGMDLELAALDPSEVQEPVDQVMQTLPLRMHAGDEPGAIAICLRRELQLFDLEEERR
jgi:hypothetical protein